MALLRQYVDFAVVRFAHSGLKRCVSANHLVARTAKDALMQWIARAVVTLWIVAGLAGNVHGQLSRPALTAGARDSSNRDEQLIRSWYRDYLGREVGPELKAWVELLRGGMSPLDVQATILGSDEFYNEKGRNTQTFVIETLQSTTWEEPSTAELRRWTDRLRVLRGDRFELAREILLSYEGDAVGGGPVGTDWTE